jgi:PIN domain nuclease of toxin-antitoxin system
MRPVIASDGTKVFVSAISALEIATKVRIGKLEEARILVERYDQYVDEQGFSVLPVSNAQARRAGLLNGPHRDPFDRVITAQAIMEGLQVVTCDDAIAKLGAETLW